MLIDRLDWDQGGAERLVVGLITHLPRERFDLTLCTSRKQEGPLLDQVRDSGIAHFTLGRTTRLDVTAWRQLTRFLRTSRIEVLHTHMFGSNVWGSIFGRRAHVPVILAHEHGWSFEGRPLRRFLDGQVVGRLATAVVAGTIADRDRMVRLEGIPSRKAIYLPGPYIPRPSSTNRSVRPELGIPADARVIGAVANLWPPKRLDVLIDAFAAVMRTHPSAHLVLAGDGPCREQLERQALSSGLERHIHFLGRREDLGALLTCFDVGAISSDSEGTSLFALECMAHKTPLVSTNVGGPSEFLEDGVSAMLVAPGDAAALAAALETLLGDPARGRLLAEAAYEKLAEFQLDRIAARWADLYERLLEERRA